MNSTMQDAPLSIASIFEHGRRVHRHAVVSTWEGEGARRATFEQVGDRARRLAGALRAAGVREGDVVGTFCFTHQEHLEAYLAVPAMGAVLHTLNVKLSPEQLAYVVNHARDRVVIVDASLAPLLARCARELATVERYVVVGDGPVDLPGEVVRYEALIAAASPVEAWPEIDERSAASMCYTSGTTGNPKGVVYSHRSVWLHSLAICAGFGFGISERDRILPIAPMFHANAWGLPYAGWMAGADFLFPGRFLQGEALCRMIAAERPTVAGAVPTIWKDVLRYAEEHPVDLASLRTVVCGGSAVPRSLMEEMERRHGVRVIQAWGMTETSPLAAISRPPKDASADAEMDFRVKSGRVVPGVEVRIADADGRELPWDGQSVGEVEVRGPWITGSYAGGEDPSRFRGGWLLTGDVGTIDERGYIQLTDRAKDVIKSGGEWISSVAIENALMGHAEVLEAAVIGVPDDRWDERPLACVALRPGAATTPEALRAFLQGTLPSFWLPERWAFVPEIPNTSVGKFDKKVLRARQADGELAVRQLDAPGSRPSGAGDRR